MRPPPVAAVDPPPPAERDLDPIRRMVVIQAVFLGMVLMIIGQLVRWQVIDRSDWLVDPQDQASSAEVACARGLILDRNHELLALNNFDYTISAAPKMIAAEDTADAANKLAAALDWPVAQMLERLEGDAPYAPIERQVERKIGKEVINLNIKGIQVQPLAVRVYPEHSLAAHTLGFVAGDEEQGTKGYYGVEGFYDETLKGKPGLREDRWNPWKNPVSFTDKRAREWMLPESGETLVLTIDRTIQYLIERELQAAIERYGAKSGCIVVMDPRTGALLASASFPTYDPNHFAQTESEFFVDQAIGTHYEPGSTFKIVTMAAALDTNVIQPTDIYHDVGYIEVGGRILKNWDERSYGVVTIVDVLVKSLNTGTAHVSTLLGPDRFYTYVNRFGFGRQTGVDLEGEVAGSVRQEGDADWHESDLGTNAFGQGIAVTPLQMVAAVGAIANRGFMMRPYVVEQLIDGDHVRNAKQVIVRQVVTEQTARTLTEMMVRVVEEGATMAQVDGYRIAGKTGTAQTPVVGGYDPNLTIASFIGFAPADDPRFVALIKLDQPSASPWGASTAAPTFARVAQILLAQLAIPPDQVRLASN